MGVPRHHSHLHRHRLSAATAVVILFFASATAFFPSRHPLGSGLMVVSGIKEDSSSGSSSEGLERVIMNRRRLSGPGSSPPTCRSKCGRCSPCKAVHVPIQPGRSIPLDYYPEAWRCKCGNKLFMP